jgi:hypothetical protein
MPSRRGRALVVVLVEGALILYSFRVARLGSSVGTFPPLLLLQSSTEQKFKSEAEGETNPCSPAQTETGRTRRAL